MSAVIDFLPVHSRPFASSARTSPSPYGRRHGALRQPRLRGQRALSGARTRRPSTRPCPTTAASTAARATPRRSRPTGYEQARETVRAFVGAWRRDAVVFTRNTTDAMNLLAHALPPAPRSWSSSPNTTRPCSRGSAATTSSAAGARIAGGGGRRGGRGAALGGGRPAPACRHRRLQRDRRAVAARRAGPRGARARRADRGGRRASWSRTGRFDMAAAGRRLRRVLRAQAVRAVRCGRASSAGPTGCDAAEPYLRGGGATAGVDATQVTSR